MKLWTRDNRWNSQLCQKKRGHGVLAGSKGGNTAANYRSTNWRWYLG